MVRHSGPKRGVKHLRRDHHTYPRAIGRRGAPRWPAGAATITLASHVEMALWQLGQVTKALHRGGVSGPGVGAGPGHSFG